MRIHNTAVFANNGIQSTPIGFPLQAVTNEALTKKKFCQSVRIFQQIFSSDNQFHTFLRSVAHMKKCVFEVMFQMFLEVLPPTTVARLPGELWEKIWKHTQNEYLYAKTVPLMSDTYYKAGLRAGSTPTPLRTLEQVTYLLVTCSVVSMTPCRRVVDTSGRGVARHLISVWVVGAISFG